jgi:hypothetical protein
LPGFRQDILLHQHPDDLGAQLRIFDLRQELSWFDGTRRASRISSSSAS